MRDQKWTLNQVKQHKAGIKPSYASSFLNFWADVNAKVKNTLRNKNESDNDSDKKDESKNLFTGP